MAEMLVLPVRHQDSDAAARLSVDLIAAYARGQDLGSRAPHIRANGERLLELSHELEFLIDDLEQRLTKVGLQDRVADGGLRRLLGTVQKLAEAAQQSPRHGQLQA